VLNQKDLCKYPPKEKINKSAAAAAVKFVDNDNNKIAADYKFYNKVHN